MARDTRRDDLRNTGIDVRELIRIVEASAPRWKVIVLASCFGGTGAGVKSAEGPMPDHRRGRPELPPMPLEARRATVVLSASYEDGPAWEDPTLGHEIYTHYLLDALSRAADGEVDLDGDGALSAFEAHGFATGRTIDHTGGRQLPSADLNAVGERDVVLTAEAPREASRGVFWLLPDWLRPRGDEGPRAWIDEEAVDASAPGQPLEAGSHRLRLHWPDGSQPDRDLAFRVGLGDDLSVGDVLARAEDQWLGLEAGVILVGGAAAYNRTNDDPDDSTDDPHDLPLAVPALRLIFEQRLAGRTQPRGLDLGLALAYWPGKVYDEPLGHLPAHYAAIDVALLASATGCCPGPRGPMARRWRPASPISAAGATPRSREAERPRYTPARCGCSTAAAPPLAPWTRRKCCGSGAGCGGRGSPMTAPPGSPTTWATSWRPWMT
ncbi:MAG: hypothetical protein QGH45_09345 [Myxococcota bacterium]|nr:hypothetical protein [Myxococcota bacterium]